MLKLSDAEVLTLVLGSASTISLAKAQELMKEYGSIDRVMSLSRSEFSKTKAGSQVRWMRLKAAMELIRRLEGARVSVGDPIRNPQTAASHFSAMLRDRDREVFALLFLNVRNRVLHYEEMFYGTVHAAAVYPREVVKCALRVNATGIIAAHNHPSGCAEPSKADEQITQRLQEALELVEVNLIDHLVIGKNEVVSLFERGVLG